MKVVWSSAVITLNQAQKKPTIENNDWLFLRTNLVGTLESKMNYLLSVL